MVGSSCCPLVALGYRGILAGGCGDAAVAAHDWETDLCHGEGILSSTCPRLHGRHPVGASRDPAERCVFLIRTMRSGPSVYLEHPPKCLMTPMRDYFISQFLRCFFNKRKCVKSPSGNLCEEAWWDRSLAWSNYNNSPLDRTWRLGLNTLPWVTHCQLLRDNCVIIMLLRITADKLLYRKTIPVTIIPRAFVQSSQLRFWLQILCMWNSEE